MNQGVESAASDGSKMVPRVSASEPTGLRYTDKVTVEPRDGKWRGYSETFGVAVYAASRAAAERRLSSAVHLLLMHLYDSGGFDRLIERLQSAGAEYVVTREDDDEVTSLKTRNFELRAAG